MSRGRAASLLAVVALVGLVLGLGITAPPPPPRGVATDALGPDGGEAIAESLARAQVSLAGPAEGGQVWALVSFAPAISTAQVRAAVGEARVSQVLYRLSLDRVQTPLLVQQVADGDAALAAADDLAVVKAQTLPAADERQAAIAAATARGLAAHCACVVGVLVRADIDTLRAVSERADVRAVEALPADAVYGRFAVRPLLPEYLDVASVGPDDGDVPG